MKKGTLNIILKRTGYLGFLVLSVLLILEFCFRYQVIEFYGNELKGLNPNLENSKEKKNILIFGDSFSAHPDSYIKHLRQAIPGINFINASIPGTGIRQHELIFKKRIKKFKPSAVIYQFYTGNDFLDIRHPVNFKTLSLGRNLYWLLSEKLLILQYFNMRLARFISHKQTLHELHNVKYSKSSYNLRTEIYFKGDPAYLSNSILLKEDKAEIYEIWRDKFVNMQRLLPDSTLVYLLVIPHCAQTNVVYLNRMQELGGNLKDDILYPEYPLLKKMSQEIEKAELINPLPFFQQKENDGVHLYYSNDPHLNIQGSKYLGEYLINELKL